MTAGCALNALPAAGLIVMRCINGLVLILAISSGCASRSGTATETAARARGTLIADAGEIGGVNQLLGFEDENDVVFVHGEPVGVKWDRTASHTGGASIVLPIECRRMKLKVAGLVRGREFPGPWTGIGAYFYSQWPVNIGAAYGRDGRVIAQRSTNVPAGKWTLVSVDVSALSGASEGDEVVFVTEPIGASGRVWCDDVVLVDDTRAIVGGKTGGLTGDHWTIEKKGREIVGQRAGKFTFRLPTSEASADGWKVEEANALRARFSSDGKTKALTVYLDGRSYWDGMFRPMGRASEVDDVFERQHAAPAIVKIAQDQGRVNRTTEGDANNDGYNEIRGAYQIVVKGARVEVELTPRGAVVIDPVLEIAGLPATGNVVVTIEGRLAESVARLSGGEVLVVVPAEIERTAKVTVSVP